MCQAQAPGQNKVFVEVIHQRLLQHMSWLAIDIEKVELQIKLYLLFIELDLIEYGL